MRNIDPPMLCKNSLGNRKRTLPDLGIGRTHKGGMMNLQGFPKVVYSSLAFVTRLHCGLRHRSVIRFIDFQYFSSIPGKP